MDKTKISNIKIDGVCHLDHPEYSDAYIESADYDGEPMTEEQLESINEDSEFVYEAVLNHLY